MSLNNRDDGHADDERPRDLVAVHEEPEGDALEDDHDPAAHGGDVVDHDVTRGDAEQDDVAHDVDGEEHLHHAHEAHRVGVAVFDGVVGFLRGLRRGLVLDAGVLARLALALAGLLGVFVATGLLGDHGDAHRVICQLVGLHGRADDVDGPGCGVLRGARDLGAVGATCGVRAFDGILSLFERLDARLCCVQIVGLLRGGICHVAHFPSPVTGCIVPQQHARG